MVTVGLVRELTAEAARRAALGAGARLIAAFSYQLTAEDIRKINELSPDIILLAGGTDGGNSEVILANARRLGESAVGCPIVYGGNRAAMEKARTLLSNKTTIITENVMPEFNMLNIEPARRAIRQVFMDRIVHAKGIDRAQAEFDAVLMPTPAAVLEGARLVADGVNGRGGLGTLLVIDPGGATTDVHSVASGNPSTSGAISQGLPEPRTKRTVEGDLGMRQNAASIIDAAGIDAIADDASLTPIQVEAMLKAFADDVERLPATSEEIAFDQALARAAVKIAVRRHCGTVETVYTVTGPALVQHGKDLSEVGTVIGTGGAIVESLNPGAIIAMALSDTTEPLSLRPKNPRIMLDRDYLLFACGLLGTVEPEVALDLTLSHLERLD